MSDEPEVPPQPADEDAPLPPSGGPSKLNSELASDTMSEAPTRNKLTQSTRSYMFLDSVDASVLYEKDGDWVLEKVPDDVKGKLEQSGETDGISSEHLEEDGLRKPHIVSIDAVTGNDTIPCNLCDKGKRLDDSELAPVWLWMYDMTTQMIAFANEYKRTMLQSDASCGEADPTGASLDDRLVASKGTQHSTILEGGEASKPSDSDAEPPSDPTADLSPENPEEVTDQSDFIPPAELEDAPPEDAPLAEPEFAPSVEPEDAEDPSNEVS